MAVPLVGAAVVAFLPRRTAEVLPKQVAFGVSLVTLAVAAAIAVGYDVGGGFQYTEELTWIEAFGAHYALGVDGLGLTLVLLTVILTPVVILASWDDGEGGRWSVNAFFAWMLALEGLAIGVFAATDVFLFYVLFEATLIPIYFLIGGFGGLRRSYAAIKFLLYSLFGGLLMLASVIGLYVVSRDSEFGPTYLLSELSQITIDQNVGRWLFLGFFIAFAIKAPMFPVHTWLPDATAAGTPGTSPGAARRENMRNWLRDRGQPVPAANATHHRMKMNGVEHDMLMPGMLTPEELARLDKARGADWDRLFLQAMIRHHEGAITMVDDLFASYGALQDDDVYKLASDIHADQSIEIERMQKMLEDVEKRGAR